MGEFKNLTQANYDLFKQHFLSDDETLVWPTLEELIEHSKTRNRDGSNVEYASSQEMQKRFARAPRAVLTPCEKEIATVIVDVVTLFFGGREWIRHRSLEQMEEYVIHAGLPLTDAARSLSVLYFRNTLEIPPFSIATAILRVLKFAFKGGGVALVWTIWGIIVKNLSWKDLILFGVEIGTEWVAFFGTDGVAGIAMIVQELDRGTWLALDITAMIECIKKNGFLNNPPSDKISKSDYFGICIQAVDYPNPPPSGGYLNKSDSKNPDYYMYGNTLSIQTADSPNNRKIIGNIGFGYGMSTPFNFPFNFQPTSGSNSITDGAQIVINGKYTPTNKLVGILSSTTAVVANVTMPQSFEKIGTNDSKALHFVIHKVSITSNQGNEPLHDHDQIVLKSVEKSTQNKNAFLSIIYDPSFASGNRQGYYIGFSDFPQVWTLYKKAFNP